MDDGARSAVSTKGDEVNLMLDAHQVLRERRGPGRIIAFSTTEQVRASTALQRIVAATALKLVIGGAADDLIIPAATQDIFDIRMIVVVLARGVRRRKLTIIGIIFFPCSRPVLDQ